MTKHLYTADANERRALLASGAPGRRGLVRRGIRVSGSRVRQQLRNALPGREVPSGLRRPTQGSIAHRGKRVPMDSHGLSPDKREKHDEDLDDFDETLEDWFSWCEWYEAKDWKRVGRFAASRLVRVATAGLALASALCLWQALRAHYADIMAVSLSIVFVCADVTGALLAGSVMVPKFGESPRSRASLNRYLLGATSLAATGASALAAMDLLSALSRIETSVDGAAAMPSLAAPPICGLALILTAAAVFLLALARAEMRESCAEELEEIGFLDGELPEEDEERNAADDDSGLPF